MVVVEDVDLVAQDRSMTEFGQPILFTLLEEMDGIASDTDVTFVLTTNRASVLERALADRPGRVDLAVEIPRPDALGREQLLRLYGRGVQLTDDLTEIVTATDGVTASFVKELIRRAVLRVIDTDPITVDSSALRFEFDAMQQEHNTVTRSLLGG
jgi:ATP-dependent 26S proteasome regulatory subunit